MTAVSPALIQRDRTRPVTTELIVEGYQLKQMTAQLIRNQSPVPGVSIEVTQPSDNGARLLISTPAQVALGTADLVLSAGGTSFHQTVQIVEPTTLPLTTDTALLWRMENTQAGAVALSDSGPFHLTATASPASTADGGRFGIGGKKRSHSAECARWSEQR